MLVAIWVVAIAIAGILIWGIWLMLGPVELQRRDARGRFARRRKAK